MNSPPQTAVPDIPFVNEVRLNWKHWLLALALITLVLWSTPRIWKKAERFETGVDYRIPYSLSRDYWLYERRLEKVTAPDKILLLGDSVIWGEYVRPDGTLSHFLNEIAGNQERFINAGVNGLFPLALEGLANYYADSLEDQKVILHCNLLWM